MLIRYSSTVVGDTPRIQLLSPFAVKDTIKATQVARWEERRKAWTIPYTRRALQKMYDAMSRRHQGCVQEMTPELTDLLRGPISIPDVPASKSDQAVYPQWDHQILGTSMIGHLEGCLLAWDMGSGKTKAVYDAIVQFNLRFTFVGCPSSVVSVWRRQFPYHVPEQLRDSFSLLSLTGETSVDRRAGKLRDAYEKMKDDPSKKLLCVINYEAAWREAFAKVVRDIKWDLAVADECHRISNHTTRICKFMSQVIGPRARRRVGLSGTPMGNGPIDAFGQFQFIEPALFGQSLTRFRAEYCIMGGFEGRQVVDYRNLDQFKSILGAITSRVRLQDVVQLPEYKDEEIPVEIGPEARRMYAELRDNFISMHEKGVITAANAITKLLRLQQMTSGYAVLTDENEEVNIQEIDRGKSEALSDIVDAAPKDEPVVVFCRFVRDLREVHRIAADLGRPSFEISGARNEQSAWESSCDLGKGPLIAVQIQAGGVGIDLTKARYCVYYSLGFSLTDYEQSRARVYRPGQKRSVYYYHLIVPGTVDRAVYAALRDKRKVVDAVIEELTSAGAEA